MTKHIKGVWAAALTPLNDMSNIDLPCLVSHANWLLEEGCHGIVSTLRDL